MAIIISVFLPMAFEWVSKYEGSNSKSGSERSTFRRIYAFLTVYMLFGFVGLTPIISKALCKSQLIMLTTIELIVSWKAGELKGGSVEAKGT